MVGFEAVKEMRNTAGVNIDIKCLMLQLHEFFCQVPRRYLLPGATAAES